MNFYSNLSYTVYIAGLAMIASLISGTVFARPVETILPHTNDSFINGTCLSINTNGSCSHNLNTSTMINSTDLNLIFNNRSLQNSTCDMCLGLVGFIKADLNIANDSIANITHFIDMVCSRIVGPNAKQCVLISKSIENIVSDIDEGLNVSQVCHSLGMC